MSAPAPAAYQLSGGATGQFRVVIDTEIVIFDATNVSTTTWLAFARGAEGSTAAAHQSGAAVDNPPTAGSLRAAFEMLEPDPVFTYTSGVLTSISYASGSTKTFNYTAGVLTSIVYVNALAGTTITKTFNYTAGVLTSITQTGP